jgi:hypothetical protein
MTDLPQRWKATNKKPSLPANEAEHEKQEEALTQEDANSGQHPSTPLPIIKPLPYSSESELTGFPMTASMALQTTSKETHRLNLGGEESSQAKRKKGWKI